MSTSDGTAGSAAFGRHAQTAEDRNTLREKIAEAAKACAGKEASKDLINLTDKLFSRAFLVLVGKQNNLTVNRSISKVQILAALFKDHWKVPQDEAALEIWAKAGTDGKTGDDPDEALSQDEDETNPDSHSSPSEPESKKKEETKSPAATESKSGAKGDAGRGKAKKKAKIRERKDKSQKKASEVQDDVKAAIPLLSAILSKLTEAGTGSAPKGTSSTTLIPMGDTGGPKGAPADSDDDDDSAPDGGIFYGVDDRKDDEVESKQVKTHILIEKLVEAVDNQTKVSQSLLESQDKAKDSSFQGSKGLSPKVRKALKCGGYVSIFDFLDFDLSKLRSDVLGYSRGWKRATDLDSVDIQDFCLAMTRIGGQ